MVTNSTSFEFGKASGHIDYLRGTRMMDFPFAQGLCGNLRLFYGRDDVSNRFRRCRNQMQSRAGATFEEQSLDGEWTPILWRMPNFIERDSEEWWESSLAEQVLVMLLITISFSSFEMKLGRVSSTRRLRWKVLCWQSC
jgi:hypothetical protein